MGATYQNPHSGMSLQHPYGTIGAYAPQPSLPIAELGNRAVAYIIDYAILGGIVLVLYVIALVLIFLVGGFGIILALLLYLFVIVIGISYHPYFEATRNGQTPGKRMRNIRVVKEDGSPCDWGAAWIRRLGLFIDAIVLGFIPGYFIAKSHPLCQRLGDQWARTVVIDATPRDSLGTGGMGRYGGSTPAALHTDFPPPPHHGAEYPEINTPPPAAAPYAVPPSPTAQTQAILAQPALSAMPSPPPHHGAEYPEINTPPPAAAPYAVPPSPTAQTQAINIEELDLSSGNEGDEEL